MIDVESVELNIVHTPPPCPLQLPNEPGSGELFANSTVFKSACPDPSRTTTTIAQTAEDTATPSQNPRRSGAWSRTVGSITATSTVPTAIRGVQLSRAKRRRRLAASFRSLSPGSFTVPVHHAGDMHDRDPLSRTRFAGRGNRAREYGTSRAPGGDAAPPRSAP